LKSLLEEKSNTTFSFLDVETTGLSCATKDKICEIAILYGPINDQMIPWQTLLNPKCPIPPEVTRIHNITYEMVKDAPTFDQVAGKIVEIISNSIVICHNASFDMGFLSTELKACGRKMPQIKIIDTLKIARERFNFNSNALGNIAVNLGIKSKDQHRALADVHTTYEIFSYFLSVLSKTGVELNHLINPEKP
jgi:DNA polymerase-3 subunit epsilon